MSTFRIFRAMLAIAALLTVSCSRKSRDLTSSVTAADTAAASQLYAGFYPVESGNYRWTQQHFSVMLKPPAGSQQKGATLQLEVFVPENHIQQLGPITLSSDAGGYVLKPETFQTSGKYVYARDIPPSELDTNVMPVHFAVDKVIRGARSDPRELAMVVTSVGLKVK